MSNERHMDIGRINLMTGDLSVVGMKRLCRVLFFWLSPTGESNTTGFVRENHSLVARCH